MTSFGNVARRNTLFNGGSSLLVYQAAETVVELNHIYDGGKACKDVSLIYGCWPFSRGSIVRYNWVHGCQTEGYEGRGGAGGIGIRADDQSRHNIFHRNVVWDCGQVGITILPTPVANAWNRPQVGIDLEMGRDVPGPRKLGALKPKLFMILTGESLHSERYDRYARRPIDGCDIPE